MKKDKWKAAWKTLLDTIEVPTGELYPVTAAKINSFKKRSVLLLPESYYAYCQIFGTGTLTGWDYTVRVPDAKSTYFGIEQFNDVISNSGLAVLDNEQCQRATFFAQDICTSWYFWDPLDVSNSEDNEYGIYIIYRSGRIEKLCGTFWELVNDIWLGTGVPNYDDSEATERKFEPVK